MIPGCNLVLASLGDHLVEQEPAARACIDCMQCDLDVHEPGSQSTLRRFRSDSISSTASSSSEPWSPSGVMTN